MMTLKLSPRMKTLLSPKQWMFFWYRHYKALFFCWFVLVLGLGAFLWYRNLYQYQWSEERTRVFLEQHFKETSFQEREFEALVDRLDERARKHEQAPSLSRDIFSGQLIEK